MHRLIARATAAAAACPSQSRRELSAVGELLVRITEGWCGEWKSNDAVLALNVDAKRALQLPTLLWVNADVPLERNHTEVFGYAVCMDLVFRVAALSSFRAFRVLGCVVLLSLRTLIFVALLLFFAQRRFYNLASRSTTLYSLDYTHAIIPT